MKIVVDMNLSTSWIDVLRALEQGALVTADAEPVRVRLLPFPFWPI